MVLHKTDANCIKFNVEGSKWCEVIQREHKNNRVYYIAHLSKKVVYQGCYDELCYPKHNIRVQLPIPDDINPVKD